MELTKDQQLALAEVRKALYERLKNFCFTEEILDNKSLYQLVCLVELLVGHRNYCPMFSHTVFALQEVFGDVIWDKPLKPEAKTEPTSEEQKTEVIH